MMLLELSHHFLLTYNVNNFIQSFFFFFFFLGEKETSLNRELRGKRKLREQSVMVHSNSIRAYKLFKIHRFNLLLISIYSFVPLFRTFYILANINHNCFFFFILKIIDKELVNDVRTCTYCNCLFNCIQYKFKTNKGPSTCDQAIDIVENN